ncbi:hypothetical protein EYF80_053560 [Liparis tanakae]|uniref:Uncharacterized protein n=1 Tax=Liparis tanakae TaxID=230148 RepID=A0A4Z2F681_9TELE|nr:hypothetical protein EYF80_053560 [Liparis tanakae]
MKEELKGREEEEEELTDMTVAKGQGWREEKRKMREQTLSGESETISFPALCMKSRGNTRLLGTLSHDMDKNTAHCSDPPTCGEPYTV